MNFRIKHFLQRPICIFVCRFKVRYIKTTQFRAEREVVGSNHLNIIITIFYWISTKLPKNVNIQICFGNSFFIKLILELYRKSSIPLNRDYLCYLQGGLVLYAQNSDESKMARLFHKLPQPHSENITNTRILLLNLFLICTLAL